MNNIKYLAKTRNMTIQDLGNAIGISRSYLSLMASGDRPLSPEARSRIAAFFSVTEEFVTGGDKPPKIIVHLQDMEGKSKIPFGEEAYLTVDQYEILKKKGLIEEREISGRNPFVFRFLKDRQSLLAFEIFAVKAEVDNYIARMDKDELEKLLLVIKELIIK